MERTKYFNNKKDKRQLCVVCAVTMLSSTVCVAAMVVMTTHIIGNATIENTFVSFAFFAMIVTCSAAMVFFINAIRIYPRPFALARFFKTISIIPDTIRASILGFCWTAHTEMSPQAVVQSLAVGSLLLYMTDLLVTRLFISLRCERSLGVVELSTRLRATRFVVVTASSLAAAFALKELQKHWPLCSEENTWAYRTAAATPFLFCAVEFVLSWLPSVEKLRITLLGKAVGGVLRHSVDLRLDSWVEYVLCSILVLLCAVPAGIVLSLLTCRSPLQSSPYKDRLFQRDRRMERTGNEDREKKQLYVVFSTLLLLFFVYFAFVAVADESGDETIKNAFSLAAIFTMLATCAAMAVFFLTTHPALSHSELAFAHYLKIISIVPDTIRASILGFCWTAHTEMSPQAVVESLAVSFLLLYMTDLLVTRLFISLRCERSLGAVELSTRLRATKFVVGTASSLAAAFALKELQKHWP
uniref:G protein-coupled receptor n=1 Tax=Steinernema glaseri TaxID=37863 RepID=A0A1I7Z9Y3_9BILA